MDKQHIKDLEREIRNYNQKLHDLTFELVLAYLNVYGKNTPCDVDGELGTIHLVDNTTLGFTRYSGSGMLLKPEHLKSVYLSGDSERRLKLNVGER